jgi:N4-(beta-N-acetylglucosaminyl)-L-asparaginase
LNTKKLSFMPDRRTFLKKSLIAGSYILIPASMSSRLESNIVKKRTKSDRPLILSTWNHGIPANERAWQVLQETGSILNGVEQGVRVTESDPDNLSVGLQGLPDREGIVTLDASIMKGDGSCGSVAFVRQVKHPISLARLVMDETPHVMIAGEGARQLAEKNGFEL